MDNASNKELNKKANSNLLLWIDLEMTGLDVKKERIIEVAAIVTDFDFNEKDHYHTVVKQDQRFLDAMDDWNKKTHGDSGLVAKIPGGKDPELVELDLMNLVSQNFGEEKPVIAGNSIAQDRLFIDQYFESFAALLHYRMLDVTSWKIIIQQKYNIKFEKKNKHQAIDDIRESIAELKYYMSYLK